MSDRILGQLVDAIERRQTAALLTVTAADGDYAPCLGRRCLLWPDAEREPAGDLGLGALAHNVLADAREALEVREHRLLSYSRPEGTVAVFVEVQAQPPHLIIAGAGHIAAPLAAIAHTCDFQVTVLDDRPQYARPERFPHARVIAGPFREELRALRGQGPGLGENDYIVLVTRGHQHDIDCLLEVLDDPLAYIGMIGSRRRVHAVFELLEREQGIPAAKFDRVHAPIGLDIGARTPAEIAVCIMAEIINVQRGGPAESLNEQIRRERQARRERAANRP